MRNLLSLMLFALSALFSSQPLIAADFRIAPFCKAQSNEWLARCQDFGPIKNLYIIGEIVKGDAQHFRQALREGGPQIERVQLRSPGGDVDEALEIGRMIRSVYLNTEAPQETHLGKGQFAYHEYARDRCRAEQSYFKEEIPCECASACFLIAAGGLYRFGSEYFLHRIKFDSAYFAGLSYADAQSQYSSGMEKVHSYLKDVGTPDELYFKMLNVDSGKVEKMSDEEANIFIAGDPSLIEWLNAKCAGASSGNEKDRCLDQQQKNEKYKAFATIFSIEQATPDSCDDWHDYGFCHPD